MSTGSNLPTATVQFTVTAPEDCSDKQFEQWILQEIGAIPTDRTNPLFAFYLGDTKNGRKLENVKVKIVRR